MKNQDPTEPMDAGEQMSQLASFSQVEQTIQTNAHLRSMLQAEALTRAGDLVGKYVKSADDEVMGMVKEVEVYSDGVIVITDGGVRSCCRRAAYFPASRSVRIRTRTEEHTSELQSLMRISYAVFCFKKKQTNKIHNTTY